MLRERELSRGATGARSAAGRVALYAVLLALAFVLTYVEHLCPLPIVVPGVRLGLANLVVLAALQLLRLPEAFGIALARIALSALLFGNLSGFFYALSGGLLSFAVMALLCRCTELPCVCVSAVGGLCHNLGQLACAVLVTGTPALIGYLPALAPAGIVSGVLVGLAAQGVLPALRRIPYRL